MSKLTDTDNDNEIISVPKSFTEYNASDIENTLTRAETNIESPKTKIKTHQKANRLNFLHRPNPRNK